MPIARRAGCAQALMPWRRRRLRARQGNPRIARWDACRLLGSRKEGVDGVDHGPSRPSPPVWGGQGLHVLRVRKIAELNEDGGKFWRLQDDEACRAFRVVIELRCPAQVVNETAREDVGVSPGLSPFEVEQDIGDAWIIKPFAPAGDSVGGILARGNAGSLRIGSAVRDSIDRRAADVR